MRFASTWTPEQDNELKRLRASGRTYTDIASLMGITKNSVVGRAHRIGLPRVKKKPAPRLSDLDPKGCRFAITPHDAGPKEHRFCGKRRNHPSSYCQHHHKIAYRTQNAG